MNVMKLLKPLNSGDAIGQYNLGAMYNYGEGVEQNYWMADNLAAKQLSS